MGNGGIVIYIKSVEDTMTILERTTGSLSPAQVDFYHEEGYLVLPHLLNTADMAPAREAMQEKVAQIADELFADGLISDKREREPFESRLARLFDHLTDARLPALRALLARPAARLLSPDGEPEDFGRRRVADRPASSSQTPSTMSAPRCPAWRRGPCPGTRTSRTGRAPTPTRSSPSGFPWWTPTWRTAACTSGRAPTTRRCCPTTRRPTRAPATPR